MPKDLKKEDDGKKEISKKKSTDAKKKQSKKTPSAATKTAKTVKGGKTSKGTRVTKSSAGTAKKKTSVKTKVELKSSKTKQKAVKKEVKESDNAVVKSEKNTKSLVTKKKTDSNVVSEVIPAKKERIISKNSNLTSFINLKQVKRKVYILDAAGKSLGRVAALAASMLRGKHKVDFTPNVDCGDFIIIINCKDMVLTGKKLEQKVRYHHSGWIGGIKKTKYSDLMKSDPQKVMFFAVKGMLAHNSLGDKMLKHLRVYSDDKHLHEAQKPELVKF